MTDENWTIIPAHEAVDILAGHFGSSAIQLSIARQWLENEIARGRMVFLAEFIKIYRIESDRCELCKETNDENWFDEILPMEFEEIVLGLPSFQLTPRSDGEAPFQSTETLLKWTIDSELWIIRDYIYLRSKNMEKYKVITYNVQVAKEYILWWIGHPDGKQFFLSDNADPQHTIPRRKSGRKPHADTDIVWGELCRLVYSGDIQRGTTQADVKRKLHAFLSIQGKEMRDETLGDKVRRLFTSLGWR